MNRADLVLAALATAPDAAWQPVQVQKLFFLLDRQAAAGTGGPHWNFAAYDYGPFDRAVYDEIDRLALGNLALVNRPPAGMRTFSLTPDGAARGSAALAQLHPSMQLYVQQLSHWVRSLSFQQLVSAIYRDFPEMKENSVFQDRT